MPQRFDVAILGGGLAGLTLAHHLSLTDPGLRIAILERRIADPNRPKVGESTVQLAGYYLSRVLRLERLLFDDHYLKYNLRFYWPAAGSDGADFADYSQCYLRAFSNICSFQIDRGRFEASLLEIVQATPTVTYYAPLEKLEVTLGEGDNLHRLAFESGEAPQSLDARWVVDATGRRRLLQKQLRLGRPSPIRHGASFLWVDGAVDIESLTKRSPDEVRLDPRRAQVGHTPLWLATNHFCGEGWWLWVIPLKGRTSIGLVFDRTAVDFSSVSSADLLLDWIRENLPLFADDLASRQIIDHSGFRDFAYDASLTLSPDRWAITGEAGRFSDPLYSPGSDLIALHNTLIVDAIQHTDTNTLSAHCRRSETLLQALYEGYVPAYAESYDALGDPETFALKYSWELAIYFSFYVFPFINDLFTEQRFQVVFLRRFARLGAINHNLQRLLSDYFQWKKENHQVGGPATDIDLFRFPALKLAEATFYRIGLTVDEAREVLDDQLENLAEMARFIVVRVASVVLARPEALIDSGFISSLDPETFALDPLELEGVWRSTSDGTTYPWSFSENPVDPAGPPLDRTVRVSEPK